MEDDIENWRDYIKVKKSLELVDVSNISIPDSLNWIPNESSFDPDGTKIAPETEESMVSIE